MVKTTCNPLIETEHTQTASSLIRRASFSCVTLTDVLDVHAVHAVMKVTTPKPSFVALAANHLL